eukprot:2919849-Rhodomonas_salina.1
MRAASTGTTLTRATPKVAERGCVGMGMGDGRSRVGGTALVFAVSSCTAVMPVRIMAVMPRRCSLLRGGVAIYGGDVGIYGDDAARYAGGTVIYGWNAELCGGGVGQGSGESGGVTRRGCRLA